MLPELKKNADGWWHRLLAVLLLALLTAAMASDAHAKAEPLEPDEDVLFLPSTARQLENGRIEVDLQAWIHERDRHKVLDAGLARYLGIELSSMSPAEQHRPGTGKQSQRGRFRYRGGSQGVVAEDVGR